MPEWSSGFPYLLQFQSEFGNKEFMIWATISSRSCFFLTVYSFSIFGCKEYNLISVLTIWWCPCVESCVVGSWCLLWPVCSFGKTLLAFALLHSEFQGQICCYSRCSLTSYFWIPVPYNDQGKRNPSKMVRVMRGHQSTDTLKPLSQKTSQSDHTDHSLV